MTSRLSRILAAVWICAATASAQTNWPQFRGTGATGIAEGPATPVSWNLEKSQNILWKTTIPGLGHSSPIIWGNKLFITTAINQSKTAPLKVGLYGEGESAADDDVQQWKVLCLDKTTGSILWQAIAHEGKPKARRHPKATHANCTMATDGDNAVAFFGSEGLYCYDMAGHLRWQKDFGVLRSSPMVYNDKPDTNGWMLEWGFASSPVIHGSRVFVQCDALTNGFVAAFELADGREVWRTKRDDTATWSTPNILSDGTRQELLVNGWKHMGGYDLRTGKEVWWMSGGGDCPVPTPIVWGEHVYIMSAHGPRKPVYVVRSDAAGDVSLHDGALTNRFVSWTSLRGASYMQTPLIYEGKLYTCQMDGVLTCFDAATGKEFYKERLGSGGEGFTASPVECGGKIYFTSEQGQIFVVKPGAEFNVIATNQMNEICMATPAISDGVIFYRTQGHVVAVGERK